MRSFDLVAGKLTAFSFSSAKLIFARQPEGEMKRLVLFPLLALAGCVTAQPGAEKIVMTGNPELVRGCQQLGQVTADQILYGGPTARDDVLTMLRNKAAQAGATHVLTLNVGQNFNGTASGLGELYRCRR